MDNNISKEKSMVMSYVKKRCGRIITAALLLCTIVLLLAGVVPDSVYADDGYIQITTAQELLGIAEKPDGNYILANDIDLTGVECDNYYINAVFTGHFNGNGKSINGVQVFMFEQTASTAVIENLNVNGTMKMEGGWPSVGLGVKENHGTIRKCTFNATGIQKTGQSIYCGIVVLWNFGTIEDCEVNLSYDTQKGAVMGFVGGFSHTNYGTIMRCTAKGSFNAATERYMLNFGGISESSWGDIYDCTNYCNVTGNVSVGGIIHWCNDFNKIINCSNYGNFNVQYIEDKYAAITPTGGIAGEAKGCIKNCTNYGDITVSDWSARAGGIVGTNGNLVIDSCVNNGKISADYIAGGIGAELCFTSGRFSVMDEFITGVGLAVIKNCVNYGEIIEDGNKSAHGIVGSIARYDDSSLIAIDNCKSYMDGVEVEFYYNDAAVVNNSGAVLNVNEDELQFLYGQKAQLTGDVSKDGIKFYSVDVTVSERGEVAGEDLGAEIRFTKDGGVIVRTIVAAVDENTGATDYCIVKIVDGGTEYKYEDGVLTFWGNGKIPYNNGLYPWREYADSTTKIVFEDGVGCIPLEAFSGFRKLETVEFADSVVFIYPYAFAGCESLKNVTLPSGLYCLQPYTFADTGIESITIPAQISEIYNNIFSGSKNLKNIYFEGERAKGIGSIHAGAFAECPVLESVTVPDGCYSLESADGVLYQNTAGGKMLLCYPAAKKDTEFTLPSDVYYIPAYAINESVYLKNFYGGSGLRYVADNNFYDCKALSNIVISDNVESFSVNFDNVKHVETIVNNSANTIPLGNQYVYTLQGNDQAITELAGGQTAERHSIDDDGKQLKDNGWHKVDGVNYWYENGVRQGYDPDNSSYRGKEIYDPVSDAWYWLDNVQLGAVAKSKDVYQESLAGEWGDKINEAGERIGKWVRYDENGHMIKGWDTNGNGTYYFDPVYGTMAKGEAVIDGQTYYFDRNTGVLIGTGNDAVKDDDGKELSDNGWHKVGGVNYWYENGVRQGYDPDNSSYRGKEIYDPSSDAWYWLDNVQDGAVAKSKDVYQESEAGDWGDIKGEDGKTYGKWVRYDENGHMIKGWDTNENGTYYFDPVYGTMAKGEAVIDGKTYYFDVNTGVLQ